MTFPSGLHPHLAEFRRQHESIRQRVVLLTAAMTDEQFNYSPGPGRWTVGQNLEHLSLEGEEQAEILRRMIERGRTRRLLADGPFQYSAWGNRYIRFLEPPYRVRIRTFPRYTAPPRLEMEAVVPRFLRIKEEILGLIPEAHGLDLVRVKAPLPYLKGWNPSLSLGQWFAYIAAHERRHLCQTQHVQGASGYPWRLAAPVRIRAVPAEEPLATA